MEQADYDALPESITVRELRYQITRPGFRTREVTLVTIPARRDWTRRPIRLSGWSRFHRDIEAAGGSR